MKIVVGGEDDQQINQLAEEYYKKSSTTEADNQGAFEAYFKQDEIKIMGLKDPNGKFPNGTRMIVEQDNKKYTLTVELDEGQRKEYAIDAAGKTVKRNDEDCCWEEKEQVLKMLTYMKKHCNNDNSETKILRFEKKGVI